MFADIVEELSRHGLGIALGVIAGALIGWLTGRWKRYLEHRSILRGDARDTVVIHQHIVQRESGAASLRIRSLGQAELTRVVPNGHLASELSRRAFHVTPRDTLISMEGKEGSYLLETLTNFVCDRVGNAPFDHDLYIMAPCCEPAGLAEHQPIAILLISVADLALFEKWPESRNVQVEHGTDGARVLTLMELARRFRSEQEKIENLRKAGQRTRYVETMYILDLALDRRTAVIPVKEVPWGRFEDVLKQMNLE
jgi:hypothetical protein